MDSENPTLFPDASPTPQNDRGRPLADRMRPQRLEDFIGQEHLVGEDGALLPLLTEGRLHSMIFWGEPGVGKTTLARLLANSTDAYFAQLSAVSSGVGDVRKVIDQARLQKRNQKATLLFIDEIHRFNKAQQDALLHAVEEGIIHLVGATTENPSFEVIAPLLSRARVYKFRPLERSHLETLLSRSLLEDEVLATSKVSLNDEAKDALLNLAMGDAREMYNLLERTVERARHLKRDEINLATLETVAAQALSRYDKSGDRHYDTISAFIKCVRNTDPDAAIYWLARMLHAGEDALFIARRLIILASEDIGNANPNALLLARACFDSVHKIGMPEARIILAQTTTYLASSPKSNASYQAIEEALAEVNKGKQYAVPLHLRNAPTGLMKEHGYGDGYLYSHNQEGAVSDMPGLPEELEGTRYYRPTEYGSEAQIKKRLEEIQRIRELRRSKKSSDSDKEGVEK